MSLGFSALLAEAAASANAAGVDPAILVEVLSMGGGDGVALKRMAPYILEHDTTAFRFTLLNALKDLTYEAQMTSEPGVSMRTAEAARQNYEYAVAHSDSAATVPELVTLLGMQAKP